VVKANAEGINPSHSQRESVKRLKIRLKDCFITLILATLSLNSTLG
jgi:hypothetical protein